MLHPLTLRPSTPRLLKAVDLNIFETRFFHPFDEINVGGRVNAESGGRLNVYLEEARKGVFFLERAVIGVDTIDIVVRKFDPTARDKMFKDLYGEARPVLDAT